MPYQLSFTIHPEYMEVELHVQIVAERELAEALERWKQVATLCKAHNKTRVLAIMEFSGTHDNEVKFQLAKGAFDIGWTPELKLAVVIADNTQRNAQQFTATAMNGLGYEMKLFAKPRQARKWLLA